MKDDRVYLEHIRASLSRIIEFTREGKGVFLADAKTQDAVIRNLEIVGEAVKQLSESFKENHPEIEWRRISGMRDFLIHVYFGVNLDTVWKVVEDHVPVVLTLVERELTGG